MLKLEKWVYRGTCTTLTLNSRRPEVSVRVQPKLNFHYSLADIHLLSSLRYCLTSLDLAFPSLHPSHHPLQLPLSHYANMASPSALASRRLFHEYKTLSQHPPDGITAGPISEDDLFLWEALIQGPEGTPYEGGVFAAELKFPRDYPLAPPSMRFLGECWHPNGRFATLPSSPFFK